MVKLSNTTYISVDLAHHEIFRAKDGKGGIILHILLVAKIPISCTKFLYMVSDCKLSNVITSSRRQKHLNDQSASKLFTVQLCQQPMGHFK